MQPPANRLPVAPSTQAQGDAVTARARLYVAEAVELLRSLEEASVGCICTDPPYASGGFQEAHRRNSKGSLGTRAPRGVSIASDCMQSDGYLELIRLVAVEAVRVLVPGSYLLVCCDWRQVPALVPTIGSTGLQYRAQIAWNKGSAGLGLGFRPQSEQILAFSLGAPRVSEAGSNVITCKRSGNAHHPSEKPLELMAELLRVATEPGDLVVDPFCGSGTTGVAAVSMGRLFVGADTQPDHVQTAVDRIGALGNVEADQVAPAPQPNLFATLGGTDGQ